MFGRIINLLGRSQFDLVQSDLARPSLVQPDQYLFLKIISVEKQVEAITLLLLHTCRHVSLQIVSGFLYRGKLRGCFNAARPCKPKPRVRWSELY